jgi:hypothetical protein
MKIFNLFAMTPSRGGFFVPLVLAAAAGTNLAKLNW